MSTSNKFLSDYVYLAEASYADFSKGYSISSVKLAISGKKEQGGIEKPEQFANLVTQNYTVEAHWKDRAEKAKDPESGFSATLFRGTEKSGQEGKYVLAMKGTAGEKDLKVTDISHIVGDGLAHHQIVDMYNFWQQINTDKGKTYQAAHLELNEIFSQNYRQLKLHENFTEIDDSDYEVAMGYPMPQSTQELIDRYGYASTKEMAEKLTENGYLVNGTSIYLLKMVDSAVLYNTGDERTMGLGIHPQEVVVTGHSLGGHLSAAFSRLFADKTTASYMVNGAGFGHEGSVTAKFATQNI